jgi:hypothetical protein
MSVKVQTTKKYLPTMQAGIALHISGEEGIEWLSCCADGYKRAWRI